MIFIIRHGQTELNSRMLLQGRSDHPLNETGRQQASEAGRLLRREGIVFARVYSSPLIRAVQTAELVAPGAEIITDERLLEMDYGPYEGTDLTHPPEEVLTFFRDFIHNPAPEGMEPLAHVVERAADFMKDLEGMEDEGDPGGADGRVQRRVLEHLRGKLRSLLYGMEKRYVYGAETHVSTGKLRKIKTNDA